MGRVRQFLSQDVDEVVEPYARFLMSHKLVLYGQGAAAIALTLRLQVVGPRDDRFRCGAASCRSRLGLMEPTTHHLRVRQPR